MKVPRWICNTFLILSLIGGASAISLQHDEKEQGKDTKDKQEGPEKTNKEQEKKASPQAQPQPRDTRQPREQQQAQPQPRPQANQDQQKQQADRQAQQNQQKDQQRQAQQQQRERTPQAKASPQPVTQNQPPGWDKGKKTGWGNSNVPPGQQKRYSQDQQQQRITQQQQRVDVYRQHLGDQQRASEQYAARLQQDNRVASYRFQQEYMAREEQQRVALQRTYDYGNDPYFYTANNYRYSRGGTFYETNQYGADTLRKAVNFGYDQGFRSGQADRQDRYSSGYRNSYAYQDANYGYDGYYSDQASYNYYFRQGFSRGYQDGYGGGSQFGNYSNGNYSVLGAVLSGILNLQALR